MKKKGFSYYSFLDWRGNWYKSAWRVELISASAFVCVLSRLRGELPGPLFCVSVTSFRNYLWSPEGLSLKNRKISLSLVRRLTQTYLKYHNPGIPNVVKVDGTLVRVGIAGAAHIVVLVPVHTHATDIELLPYWIVIIIIILVQTTLMASLLQWGYFVTAHNSIVSWQRADKGHLIIFLWLVIRGQDNVTLSAKEPTVKFPVAKSFLSRSWKPPFWHMACIG